MTYAATLTRTVDVNGAAFAYRELGSDGGTPLILLHHLTANLDDWDPRVVDGLAAERRVIAFDNRGVGGSTGQTPGSVREMAQDAVAFIAALGLEQVDLLGFSLGGFIAQVIAQEHPALVRRLIVAGSGPEGGEGISNMGAVLQDAVARAGAAGKHPKHFLFFSPSPHGQAAADAFLARLNERTSDRDAPVSNETIGAQLTAITAWGQGAPSLGEVRHPVLVVNGDRDVMAPSVNSPALAGQLPNAQLSIFPDAGHGGIFQYHDSFVGQALDFLR